MRLAQGLLIAALTVGAFAAQAKADYFVWQDEKSGLSMSYPDTWGKISTRQPDDIFAIVAPNAEDDAVCRIRVRTDRRFVVYPPNMDKDVQSIAVSKEFWDNYLHEYKNVDLYGYTDGAGLGKGFGSFAVIGYDGSVIGPETKHRGIAVASLYFGKIYVVDCTAKASAFEKWQPQFLSIIGSVDFKKAHDELWTGNYRNFFADPALKFKWPHAKALITY
ncbi:MAG: hypothetical protein JWO78_484 [Micavibrio sp.]|nr:hypothetical protein [Micavibrio sp.]